jgi:hypothetical protein
MQAISTQWLWYRDGIAEDDEQAVAVLVQVQGAQEQGIDEVVEVEVI